MPYARRHHAMLLLGLLLACAMPLAAGCPSAKTTARGPMKVTYLRVSGSGTCLPLLRLLDKDFQARNPSVRLRFLPGMHSSGGIKGASTGVLDIGAVSRALEADERALGLRYHVLSRDPLVIGTNPSVELDSITSEEIRGIYSGRIADWRSLGLRAGRIVVLDRNEDESAKIILRKYVLGPARGGETTDAATVLYFESDMIAALRSVPNSIGYLSGGFAKSKKLNVNIVKLDGVYPSVDSVTAGKYRMTRPLGIVLPRDPRPEATAFLRFARSDAGRDLMRRAGFPPAE